MKGKLNIYYDKEGDFLELYIGKQPGGFSKNLGDGIFEIVDKKTNKVVGIAIHDFIKRAAKLKEIETSLPVNIEILS